MGERAILKEHSTNSTSHFHGIVCQPEWQIKKDESSKYEGQDLRYPDFSHFTSKTPQTSIPQMQLNGRLLKQKKLKVWQKVRKPVMECN